MSKVILYMVIAVETLALIVLGLVLIQQVMMPTPVTETDEAMVTLTAREMTVYVKRVGAGGQATDVVGKAYLQDDATGRTEFLFDVGAGCFPTWSLNPRDGFNLLVVDTVDVQSAPLETLMQSGQLRYTFRTHGDVHIHTTFGIRSATLTDDNQSLRLTQQCS